MKVDVTAIPWDAAHDKFTTAITANKTPDAAMVDDMAGRVRRSRRPRPDPTVDRQVGILPGRPEDHRGGRHLVRHPVVRRDSVGLLPHGPRSAGRVRHPAERLGRPQAMAKAMQTKAGAKWGMGFQAGGTGS